MAPLTMIWAFAARPAGFLPAAAAVAAAEAGFELLRF